MTHRLRGRSVRVDPSHDFPAEIYDCMAISIVTNVGLDLATSSWPDGPNAAGCYTVNKNALLSKVSAGADVHGILSPASPITVPVAHRKGAGIPLRAASYCYIYPIGGSLYSELLSVSLASYPWALVLLCGGFGYYDHAGDLVQINAISYAPSNTGVVVVGSPVPAKTRDVILEAMQRQGRMIPFHQPALIEAGFVSFGWVHGGESFEGADLSDEANSNEHGAFVYLRKPPSEDRSEDRGAISQSPIRTIHLDGRTTIPSEKQADELRESGADTFTFYALTPSTGAGFQTMLARVKSDLQNAPQTKQLGDCKLSEAMLSMSHRCVEAMKVADEASQIATLARTTQEPSPPLERLKWQAVRLVALVSYLMLGVLVYAHTEEHDGGTPWTYDEALYFSVVTISTVGYGDISPSKPETKAFTAIYILFGVAIVFGLAGEPFSVYS